MEPYVGQIVHFVDAGAYKGKHLAAIVTWVVENTDGKIVNLNVQDPGTSWPVQQPVLAMPGIGRDDSGQLPGTWHFIENINYTLYLGETTDEHD